MRSCMTEFALWRRQPEQGLWLTSKRQKIWVPVFRNPHCTFAATSSGSWAADTILILWVLAARPHFVDMDSFLKKPIEAELQAELLRKLSEDLDFMLKYHEVSLELRARLDQLGFKTVEVWAKVDGTIAHVLIFITIRFWPAAKLKLQTVFGDGFKMQLVERRWGLWRQECLTSERHVRRRSAVPWKAFGLQPWASQVRFPLVASKMFRSS